MRLRVSMRLISVFILVSCKDDSSRCSLLVMDAVDLRCAQGVVLVIKTGEMNLILDFLTVVQDIDEALLLTWVRGVDRRVTRGDAIVEEFNLINK